MNNTLEFNKKCGDRLKKCREKQHITQEKLAKKSNYSKTHISYIENGRRCMSAEAAQTFSSILGVRQKYLLGIDNFETSEDYLSFLGNSENINRCISDICSENGYLLWEIEGEVVETAQDPIWGETNIVNIDKWFIISDNDKSENDEIWRCSEQQIQEFFEDIQAYTIFKLKRLITKCTKATAEEKESFHRFVKEWDLK